MYNFCLVVNSKSLGKFGAQKKLDYMRYALLLSIYLLFVFTFSSSNKKNENYSALPQVQFAKQHIEKAIEKSKYKKKSPTLVFN